jgi:hypothetical protein
MRLLIVQYADDYREAFHDREEGGGENCYAQQYSVDSMSKVAASVDELATLSFLSNDRYEGGQKK